MSEIIEVHNEDDLKLIMNTLFGLQTKAVHEYFFRGISKADQINPSLIRYYRQNENGKDELTKHSLDYYEDELLCTFGKYSNEFLPNFSNSIDFVASAQHYGIPTRLIDWTYNPFTALYFAVNKRVSTSESYQLLVADRKDNCFITNTFVGNRPYGEPPKTSIPIVDNFYYFIELMSTKNLALIDNVTESVRGVCTILRMEPNRLLFCETYNSNPRLRAQQGLFQIPLTLTWENGKYIKEINTESQCEKIIKIDSSLRETILVYLESLGIDRINLFPDLPSICGFIRDNFPKWPGMKRVP